MVYPYFPPLWPGAVRRESLAAEGGVEAVAAALETCNAIAARVFEAADAVPDIAEGLATRLTFKRAPSTAGDGENSVFAACVELARTSQFLAAAGITAQLRVWDSGLADQVRPCCRRNAPHMGVGSRPNHACLNR